MEPVPVILVDESAGYADLCIAGGLLGAFATTNGGNHAMEAYINRWEYSPKAQQIDYGKFDYCHGDNMGCML